MNVKLRVFVSSKAKELENERLMVIKTIQSLYMDPVSSESRSATFVSMEEANQKEVRSSDIYIGIFARCYSEPTIKEFHVARENNKVTLIFKKIVRESEPRDPELQEFLTRIQDVKKGMVTEYFSNIFDLRKKVKKALLNLLVEQYLTINSINIEAPRGDSDDRQVIDMDKVAFRSKIKRLSKDEFVKFNFNMPSKYGDRILISEVCLSPIEKSKEINIKVILTGTISKGFLDLFILDSVNNPLWFPDPNYWDGIKDEGRLTMNNEQKLCEWSVVLPDYLKRTFRTFILLFEDSDGNTQDKRKIVDGVEILT
jgi:hypothetical protein